MSEDISFMIDKISDMINNNEIPDEVINMAKGFMDNSSKNDSTQDVSSDTTSIDPDILLKITKAMSMLNAKKEDDRAHLLMALKPYLNDSRKEKLDKYIKFLNISQILEIFNDTGGDKIDVSKK